MNISAINCTPIKPRAAFRGSSETMDESKKFMEASDKLNSRLSNSKTPAAIAGSLMLAALLAAKGGKAIGAAASKIIPENFANSAAGLIKSGADKTAGYAQELMKSNSKLQKYTGTAIGAVNKGAKKLYKFAAGDAKTPVESIGNIIGKGTAAGILGSIVTRDSDGNGKLDIFDKSRNVYTGAKYNTEKAINTFDAVSDVIASFS